MLDSCYGHSTVSLISAVSGGASLAAWIVAQLPQLVETYNNKSVEGLSGFFVMIWITGDICSFIGCVLTQQMYFQYVLALYFLFNDFVLAGQYYYYGYYLKKHNHKHRHHHHHHNHNDNTQYNSTDMEQSNDVTRTSNNSVNTALRAAIPATILATQVGQGNAMPIPDISIMTEIPALVEGDKVLMLGTLFAWLSAALYFFSRIPQLIKNYQRKSTEDVSPFLFACTLFGNLTYTTSILANCDFVFNDEKRWEFFYNELPYMIGSGGTIIFDIVYFYQLWLYSEPDEAKRSEETPLLSSS